MLWAAVSHHCCILLAIALLREHKHIVPDDLELVLPGKEDIPNKHLDETVMHGASLQEPANLGF